MINGLDIATEGFWNAEGVSIVTAGYWSIEVIVDDTISKDKKHSPFYIDLNPEVQLTNNEDITIFMIIKSFLICHS